MGKSTRGTQKSIKIAWKSMRTLYRIVGIEGEIWERSRKTM
jgi:hypothetical protein